MPIYEYRCSKCKTEVETVQQIGASPPICCGEGMEKTPTFPAMVKMKGEGGYPSRRKWAKGTAPNTTRATKVWSPDNDVNLS